MNETVIGDRYRIGHRLGKGGMAVVYQARDTKLDRDVAIKLLNTDLVEDPIFQRRFRREVMALVSSSHPNTVAVTVLRTGVGQGVSDAPGGLPHHGDCF
jgi:serine/threonine-protein kinase